VIRILPNQEFYNLLPDCETIWQKGLAFKASLGNTTYYPQRLFVRNAPPVEIEDFLQSEFGAIKPLSTIVRRLYREKHGQSGKRYGAYLRSEQMDFARRLPMNGREFVRPGHHPNMLHADRNAAYSACCVDFQLPVGYFLRKRFDVPTATFYAMLRRSEGGFGFFKVECLADIPVQGVLPVKSPNGRIVYPGSQGERFEGVWTFNEVQYALSIGYRVESVWWLWHSPVSFSFLSDIAMELWDRRESAEGTARCVWKGLASRLIGGLAMQRGSIITLTKGGTHQAYGELWHRATRSPGVLSNRLHAAYIVAEQRIALHKVLVQAGNPVYAFTDSVVCEDLPDISVGTGLGEWKVLGEPRTYEVRGLGQYRARGRTANRGRWL